MPQAIRTKWMDPDFRRQPKTDRFCILCQRDLKAGQRCRAVRWELDVYETIHPEDYAIAEAEIPVERRLPVHTAIQRGLVGMDCAGRLRLGMDHRGGMMRVHLNTGRQGEHDARAQPGATSRPRAACGTRTTKRANVLRLPWVTGDPEAVTCERCRSRMIGRPV